MKSGILVIGEYPLVRGLMLAGVKGGIVCTKKDFEKKFFDAISENKEKEEFGIFVVQSSLVSSLSPKGEKEFSSITYPIIVQVPGPSDKVEAGDEDLRSLVKRALGFDVFKD